MVQNRSVYISVEVLTIIISAAGLLVTLGGGIFAGFAWMIRRTDDQFAGVREEFRAEFRTVHEEFGSIREEFRSVRDDLSQLRGELTEVKISVARLEGPRERLILPRGSTNH